MSIIKAPDEIAGSYQSYAPGHGALCFVHIDASGRATNEPVPIGYIKLMLPDGWALTQHTGRWEAYRPIRREGPYRLSMDGESYRYQLLPDNQLAYEFYFWEGKGWELLRNESRRASIRYFLSNEFLIGTPPVACRSNVAGA